MFNNPFKLPFSSSFVAFNNVRIPRECLLNKESHVTPDGQYVSSIKDPRKRFAAALGALSQGRVGITEMCVVNLKLCLTIAIRFVSLYGTSFTSSEAHSNWPFGFSSIALHSELPLCSNRQSVLR